VAAGIIGYYAWQRTDSSVTLAQEAPTSTAAKTTAAPATLICGDRTLRYTFLIDFDKSIITKAEYQSEEYSYGNWSTPKPIFEGVPFTATDMAITWIWKTPGGGKLLFP
jgi:hypothetical protein